MSGRFDRPELEEHVLAARSSGILWLTVPPLLVAALLFPGIDDSSWQVVVGLAVGGMVWGAASLLLVPWERLPPTFGHVPALASVALTAALVAATGGDASPIAVLYFLIVAHSAYFFARPEAIAYAVVCLLAFAAPVAYEPGAVDDGWLGYVWVAALVFVALCGVIIAGKGQLIELREKARAASLRDPLTGLANRRALAAALDERMEERRGAETLGLILVDLDDFKDVNSLHGYIIGDEVLNRAADALRGAARSSDLVVRFGGDEFAILVSDIGEEGVRRIADDSVFAIKQAVAEIDLPGMVVTASAGWVFYGGQIRTPAKLLSAADLAMRAAKLSGKDRVHAPLPETAMR